MKVVYAAIYFRVDHVRQLVEIARVVHGARSRDLGRLPDTP